MNWLELLFGIGDNVECLTAVFGLVPAIIAGATAAITASVSAAQAAKASKEARRKEEKNAAEIEEAHRKQESLITAREHQDMTDRTEVAGMWRKLREENDAQRQVDENRADTMGETGEIQLAGADARNKVMADSIANMTQNSSMIKDALGDKRLEELGNYSTRKQQHNTTLAGIDTNKSNQWSNATNNSIQAMTGAATAAAGLAGQKKFNQEHEDIMAEIRSLFS